ncbi:AraC family transcriptional regulator [Mesorhizobium sp. NBSH29]|uniref:AraC family transcriptional regulator n=1 Tax=Mesorhizobium sp. NBSH29 TaxID=2654249 RepID=UPI00215649D2|nr:AraC family transcriptional regulator [Mesorhizobium sp. NBSH29]
MDYATAESLPFSARIDSVAVGNIVVGTMFGTVTKAERTRTNISEDTGGGYCLFINEGATDLVGTQRNREFTVAAGEAVLLSGAEPIKMAGGDENVWTSVIMPDATLTHEFSGIDDRTAIQVNLQSEGLRFLKRYWQFVASQPPVTAAVAAHTAETIVDLVGLAVGLKGRDIEVGSSHRLRAARVGAVLKTIADHYSDPNLSVQTIAAALSLSVRYIHDLLHETGQGFSERVLELRLQKARRLLADHASDALRISDIALLSGFNDVSYFNRCFRRRFGCTPTAAR